MILKAREVRLRSEDRAVLEARCRGDDAATRCAAGADHIAGGGRGEHAVDSRTVGVEEAVVSTWRNRFADEGLEGLKDRNRSGKPKTYTAENDRRILAVLDGPVPEGHSRWTAPLIAERLGDVHEQRIWRVLRKHKIDLAGRKSWCESTDPEFVAKAADVVGLYMAPPENAMVICVDEKPSIQALERAQGYLRLPNGRTLTGRSHDYKRQWDLDALCRLRDGPGKVTAAHKTRR
jgi:transposase